MRAGVIAIAGAMLLLFACAAADGSSTDTATPISPGESIFTNQCVMCHGRKGNLNMSGAKDLTKSVLTEEEMIAIVTNGKGGMIGFGKKLSKKQVEEVVDHVRTLHEEVRSDN